MLWLWIIVEPAVGRREVDHILRQVIEAKMIIVLVRNNKMMRLQYPPLDVIILSPIVRFFTRICGVDIRLGPDNRVHIVNDLRSEEKDNLVI